MPFIEDDKLNLMNEDLDNAKLQREASEKELEELQKQYNSLEKTSKILPAILGLLLGFSIWTSWYYYSGNGGGTISDIDINAIKKEEAIRVTDSIYSAQEVEALNNTESNNLSVDNIDQTINKLDENTAGTTIYSVQIGVFSDKKFPLISTQTIPSTVSQADGYFKYSVGLFSTIEEAQDLKKELIKVGFKDAFVASYINGDRQKIHH